MAKRKTSKKQKKLSQKSQRLILVAVIIASLGVLVGMTLLLPGRDSQPGGVGADGFSAYVDKNKDLGVKNVVSKKIVDSALGNAVKTVGDVEVTKVFNLNGTLGQTATFPVTYPDDSQGTMMVDQWNYQSETALQEAGVTKGTGAAGTINGTAVRYLPAITMGGERSYTLQVTKGAKLYQFIITQPSGSTQIKEYKAQDVLKAIIAKSNL